MWLQPLLTGLSVGAFCLTTCFPFMGSILVAENRPFKKNLRVVIEFLGGRLAGYLTFGFLTGYLGEKVNARWLHLANDISLILLSILLIAFLTGLIREQRIFCISSQTLRGKSPAIMGFLLGINLCPPFLLSLSYIFTQRSAWYGIFYFFLFFIASSIYFLPLAFAGLLSKTKEFQQAAHLSGYLVAIIFFIYGLYSILHNYP